MMNWTVTITKSTTPDTFVVNSSSFDIEGANQNSGTFGDYTLVDNALYSAGTLYGMFQMRNGISEGAITGMQVDFFQIGSVPEPSSLVLIGLGGLVAFTARRKRMRKAA